PLYLQAQEEHKRRRLLLRLWNNSALYFEELAEYKSATATKQKSVIRLDLKGGGAMFQVTRPIGPVDCQVRFTNCLAMVHGGTVDIRDGTLKIVKGTASVTQATGQVVEVPDGFSFNVETGAIQPLPADVIRALTPIVE